MNKIMWTGISLAALLLGSMSAVPGKAVDTPEAFVSRDVLEWDKNIEAVWYEVEVFDEDPGEIPSDEPSKAHAYDNPHVYVNSLVVEPSRQWGSDAGFYWRVRAFDLDGQPITDFSPLSYTWGPAAEERNAPVIRNEANRAGYSTLLYPVYSFTWIPGAVKYEVEVTDEEPEDQDGIAPSAHRVWSQVTELTDLYDEKPRIGTYWWRVRGLAADGSPVGVWSLPQAFDTNPGTGWTVGVFGDSISHGGGHLSYAPTDAEYSYEAYLDFPVINLSQSGDTSQMMVERFEQDVPPFHVPYLLIMGGSNSLRAGVDPKDVITDLKEIQEKARSHGMEPILLTLPPINPANIKKAFQEPTVKDWKSRFDKVNAWIRTQPHIDTAEPFQDMDEMPTELALDGLHGDSRAKEMMADEINAHIWEFIRDN